MVTKNQFKFHGSEELFIDKINKKKTENWYHLEILILKTNCVLCCHGYQNQYTFQRRKE